MTAFIVLNELPDIREEFLFFAYRESSFFEYINHLINGLDHVIMLGDEQLFQMPLGLVGGHFQDGVDGFLLGGVDKAAGVHKDHVRGGGIGDDLAAVLLQHGLEEPGGVGHVEGGEIVYKGQKFDESILENKRGDVNGDGVVNIADITTLIDILLKR